MIFQVRKMNKVIVIGCPGSGKSTLSIELARITGLPLCHLDLLYWNTDKTAVDRAVFMERLENVLKGDKWIIDGNYGATLEMRLSACDTVIFLDYPTELCLEGIRLRRGKPRPDMAWIESEEDAEFVDFIINYNSVNRPKVLKMLSCNKEKTVIILKNRDDAEKLLNDIKSE